MQSNKVVLGCTLHQNALTYISQAIFTVVTSETADSTDAAHENNLWRLLLTDSVEARLAGYKRKHNACRADIGGCVSSNTYTSRVKRN